MKPHLYFWDGSWWVSRNGRHHWRIGLTLNDRRMESFAAACLTASAGSA